jgi:hypothetical protein
MAGVIVGIQAQGQKVTPFIGASHNFGQAFLDGLPIVLFMPPLFVAYSSKIHRMLHHHCDHPSKQRFILP